MKSPDADKRGEAATELADIDIRVGKVSVGRAIGLSLFLLLLTLLVLFGVLYVARGSPVHGVVVEGLRALPPSVDDPVFARTMELHAGARLLEGNNIEILLDGNGTFPKMWSDIRQARRSLTVQMYYCTPGALADTVARILAERSRAGVRVLMLLDAFGCRTMQRRWLDSLQAAGVDVQHLRPLKWYKLDRLSHRSHVRSVVVDGQIGYAGGFGFGDPWLGDGRAPDQWRETNVRATGAIVAQLQAAFMAGWAEATGELMAGELYFPSEPPVSGGVRAAMIHFAPTQGSAAAERFLALSIASARRTLYIANSYFVPDVQFRRMLKDAVRRGVDVRVLTAGEKTDEMVTLFAARARYEELLAAGVRIYEYRPTMMHAKAFVVDGRWSSIGSLNFDNRSMSYNDEANAVMLDQEFGAKMDSLFMTDLSHSDEMRLETFRRRPWWCKLMEFGANLISDLL
jgi:cardiolipin synthase